MKYIQALVFLFAICLLCVVKPLQIFAATPPSFPACANPQGIVTSSYPSGSFGIVGKEGNFQGSDTVYKLSGESLTQCFCSVDGSGVQTNWWKVSSLTSEEINDLIAKGWILVPDGSAWGLDAGPYLAQNANYSCGSSGGSWWIS